MQLCATLTSDDLTSIVEQITPLRVTLRPRRVVSLGRPSKVELVAGAGLRIRGDAHFTWDAYGLTIPVTLRAWQVLLVPSFAPVKGRHVLAFNPMLEDLDLKGVPALLDARLAGAVKDGLAAQRGKLAWDFEKTLTVSKPLPAKLSPAGEWKLAPTGGNVTVTATEVKLTLDFGLKVLRTEQAKPAEAPADAGKPRRSGTRDRELHR